MTRDDRLPLAYLSDEWRSLAISSAAAPLPIGLSLIPLCMTSSRRDSIEATISIEALRDWPKWYSSDGSRRARTGTTDRLTSALTSLKVRIVSICQIWCEVSRNFAEVSAKLRRTVKLYYVLVAKFHIASLKFQIEA